MAGITLRVFLDANVYFAGCFSPTGASAVVLQLATRRHLRLVASRLVLCEAERNLRAKGSRKALQQFRQVLREARPAMVQAPVDRTLARYEGDIHPKDVPILAAALEAGVDGLVTLDRRHFFTPAVRSRAGRIPILTPGEFLTMFLQHTGSPAASEKA